MLVFQHQDRLFGKARQSPYNRTQKAVGGSTTRMGFCPPLLLVKECDRKLRPLGHVGFMRLNFKRLWCTSRHCRMQTLGPRLN